MLYHGLHQVSTGFLIEVDRRVDADYIHSMRANHDRSAYRSSRQSRRVQRPRKAWERIAVVTDVDWIRTATKAFGFAMPGEVRVFSNAELGAARDWLTG